MKLLNRFIAILTALVAAICLKAQTTTLHLAGSNPDILTAVMADGTVTAYAFGFVDDAESLAFDSRGNLAVHGDADSR